MAIEDALYTRLSGHAGLSALVGDRIYPVKLPQSPVYPAVIYDSRGGDRLHNMGVDAGIRRPIFQIACVATTYDAAANVGEQVIVAAFALPRHGRRHRHSGHHDDRRAGRFLER